MSRPIVGETPYNAQSERIFPFIPLSTPFKNVAEVWDFLSSTLRITRLDVVETTARFTNILLGRLQEPTVVDAIYSTELINRKHPLDNYHFSARWEDDCDLWPENGSTDLSHVLQLRVHEKISGTVNCPIGYLRYAVRDDRGGIEARYLGLHTVTCVEELEDYRVFDGLVGFDDRAQAGWSYAVGLSRDLRAWAGSEMGDMYDAFLAYARKLIETKRASNTQVRLAPFDHDQVRLSVKVHRGPIELAGFTTMVEFDEVLTKEKH